MSEEQNQPVTNLNFSQAIEQLKLGERVARADWAGAFINYIACTNTTNIPCEGYHAANTIDKNGNEIINPHTNLTTAAGEVQPDWLAQDEDLLASDWQVVSE